MGREAIRPPRRPARFRMLAAVRPIALVVVAVAAALFLMLLTARFAIDHADNMSGSPWTATITNRSGVLLQRVQLLAMPAEIGAYAISDTSVLRLKAGDSHRLGVAAMRRCQLRVEIDDGTTVHGFDRVVRLIPHEGESFALEITPGPRLNGREPNSTRSAD